MFCIKIKLCIIFRKGGQHSIAECIKRLDLGLQSCQAKSFHNESLLSAKNPEASEALFNRNKINYICGSYTILILTFFLFFFLISIHILPYYQTSSKLKYPLFLSCKKINCKISKDIWLGGLTYNHLAEVSKYINTLRNRSL